MTLLPPNPDLPHPLEGNIFDETQVRPTFTDELNAFRENLRQKENIVKSREKYLREISKSTDGSELEDFMTTQQIALCTDFLNFVRDHSEEQHPMQTPLVLEVARSENELLWGEEKHEGALVRAYPGKRMKRSILRPRPTTARYEAIPTEPLWEGSGFYVGEISGVGTNYEVGVVPAYLCTDGKLRCKRTPDIFDESYAIGYGTVPEGLKFVPGAVSWSIDNNGNVAYNNRYHAALDHVLIGYGRWFLDHEKSD